MHDEFIEYETWYFIETKGKLVKELYKEASKDNLDFILEKYSSLHIMNLTAPIEELKLYFEDGFTEKKIDTKISRRLNKDKIIRIEDDKIIILARNFYGIG